MLNYNSILLIKYVVFILRTFQKVLLTIPTAIKPYMEGITL